MFSHDALNKKRGGIPNSAVAHRVWRSTAVSFSTTSSRKMQRNVTKWQMKLSRFHQKPFVLFAFVFVFFIFAILSHQNTDIIECNCKGATLSQSPVGMAEESALVDEEDFPSGGYDNVTGADRFIVPNIIHFVRFNLTEYTFIDYVVLRAAMRNHRPDHFYIHTDTPNGEFTGKYWERIRRDRELYARIRILPLELPSEVFGQRLSEEWRVFHGSDVARIRLMMEYGGIYLDNDVFVLRNLDKYRKFEMTMNWDEDSFLGNQVIICNKNARFLKPWIESYRDYRENEWYYNGGVRPTTEILERRPELMHRVRGWFGVDSNVIKHIYETEHFNGWRRLDAIHLLMGHRYYLDPHYKRIPEFNEENIVTYKYPFGEMVRDVLDDSPGNGVAKISVKPHRL